MKQDPLTRWSSQKKSISLLYWPLVGLYAYVVFLLYRGPVYAFSVVVIDLPLQICFAFLFLRWVMPLARQGRWGRFLLLTLGFVMVISVLGRSLLYFYATLFMPAFLSTRDLFSLKELIGAPFDYITIPALYILIRSLQASYDVQLQNQRLLSANRGAELRLLKAQINPHFLFNTLNNLYGLCLTGAQNAAGSVLQLSKIMEYMLYESNRETVSLAKELDYLENYIALEKLRYGHRLNLSVSFELGAEKRTWPIAPLLLLPFVENAFKHGVTSQDGEAWIAVQLTFTGAVLKYVVTNSCPPATGSARKESGSGLAILQQRLELTYPERYRIQSGQHDGIFLAKLEISY